MIGERVDGMCICTGYVRVTLMHTRSHTYAHMHTHRWRNTPLLTRTRVMFKFQELIRANMVCL